MNSERDSPLDYLFLSYSCPVEWSTMEGDELERLCRQCDKKVYNISSLSKKEAEALLQKNESNGTCYNFYLRPDGTIKVDNCPKILRPMRKKLKWFAQACSFLIASIFTVSYAKAQPRSPRTGGFVPNNYQGKIIRDFIKIDAQDQEDLLFQDWCKKLAVNRSYTDEDYLRIERYFQKKGLKEKAFLALQARVVNHNSAPGYSKEAHRKELEAKRSNLLESLISDAKISISENNFDFAVMQINDCINISIDPYTTLKGSGELPPQTTRWPYICGKAVNRVIMSEKQRKTLIEFLYKSKPSRSDTKKIKQDLLKGLDDSI